MTKQEALKTIENYGLNSTYYFTDKRGTTDESIFSGTEAKSIIEQDPEWNDDGIVLYHYNPFSEEEEEGEE